MIGGGFCGLAAAYELGRRGVRATVLERGAEVGGLAGSFAAGGERIEKFYHHWFTGDVHVMSLIEELGRSAEVVLRPTRIGTYYAHNFFRLSTPLDLLRFSPPPFLDRLRLGLLALRARRMKDWRALEDRTARRLAGRDGRRAGLPGGLEAAPAGQVRRLGGRSGAVWFWNKLKQPPHAPGEYVDDLRRICYLANVCVVLKLDRSLSDIYWLNVNDPGFPFVEVIEHTNFEPTSTYAGQHIVYLCCRARESDRFEPGAAPKMLWWPGHRPTDSFGVCSPPSRRVASLRPRFAGLSIWTAAPRTPAQTRHLSDDAQPCPPTCCGRRSVQIDAS